MTWKGSCIHNPTLHRFTRRTGESEQPLSCRPVIHKPQNKNYEYKSALVDSGLIRSSTARNNCRKCSSNVKKHGRPGFLYQDGARNERDLPGIEACRESYHNRLNVNRTLYRKEFRLTFRIHFAKMAFSKVDKCIVLEDDDSLVSFSNSARDADKYEHDTRIT
jgi:hypothetical protein